MSYLQHINITTLYLVYMVSVLVMLLVLLIVKPAYGKSYFNYFIAGYGVRITGSVAALARDVMPLIFGILLSNVLLMISTVLIIMGLKKMMGREHKIAHPIAVIVLYMILQTYYTYVYPNLSIRILLFSFAVILLVVVIIKDLISETLRTGRMSLLIILMTYLASVANHILRAVISLRTIDHQQLFSDEFSFKFYLIMTIIIVLVRVIAIMFYHQKDLID